MMRDHYNFTIMGSQTPVSGFKVETNKPTITLKGNITSPRTERDLLVNLELVAGVQNDFMQLFSGNDLSGFFKGSIGFNKMIKQGNDAKYMMPDEFMKKMTRKKVCQYREEVAKQIDSMLVIEALESFVSKKNPTLSDLVISVASRSRMDEFTIEGYRRMYPNDDESAYYKKFILDLIKSYGADEGIVDEQKRFEKFIAAIGDNKNLQVKAAKIVGDWKRLSKFKTDRKHKYRLMDAYEIEAYQDVWKSKRISWINVSFAGSNSRFKLYDAALNALTDSNSFLPSLSVTYNYFWKATPAHKYFFIRTGLSTRRVNSLVDITTFDYNKETVVNVTPTEVLTSKKTGTAYAGNLKHGFGLEVPIEIYWAPWNLIAVPGLYTKVQYNYGEAWINKNKVAFDFGVVWNVVNNDKDAKNLLTIVPFISWSNLLKEYIDVGKTKEKSLSDVFQAGLKFGIPVNLGR